LTPNKANVDPLLVAERKNIYKRDNTPMASANYKTEEPKREDKKTHQPIREMNTEINISVSQASPINNNKILQNKQDSALAKNFNI